MDKQSLTRLQRQLTGKYVATNGLFWMAYVCIWGFGAVYLKGKGFSSTETGIITALGGLISVVFQPLLEMCIRDRVNTVVREGDRYVGYLTDGTGFLQALATEGIDIAGKKLVILGKGGAATAISVQAALDGAAKITIFNRSDASENAELIRKATGCQAEAYSIADTTTCLLYTSVPVCVPDLSDQTGDGRRGGFWVYVYPQSKSGQKLKGLRTGGISGGHAGQRGGASALEIQPAAGEPGGGAPSRIGGSH